ncbi:MAG: FAD-linked oxidase C-terminal domain-containing protein [Chloroflexota bacterium]|nr:FAD-linked oxidase C-terminal domain-containing protein [Chloroflexota bacterium]
MIKPEIVSQLQKITGKEGVLTVKEDLNAYSYDGTTTWTHMPDVVVLPTTTEQISQVLKLANENKVPVTTRGAGTNVSGGSIPIKGGIVLCTTRMNQILDINKTNLTATVEPGVVLQDFNIALAKEGLFYPPDPQSFLGCTMGGTVAENAGGPYCVKYGVTKQYLLGLEVVLANGYVMKVGGVTVKNRTGYELVMLFTGSEGTLAVITKITLRLLPMPAASKTMMAVFDDMAVGGQAVSNIIGSGVVPAKIEFVDNFVVRRIEQMTPMGLPVDANALLLLQADGNPAAVEADAQQIVDILKESGAREVRVAKDAAEAAAYWKMRSAGFAAVFGAAHTVLAEDVAVPRDKLAEFIKKLGEISERTGFFIQYLGHAGDGNLHPSIFTDMRKEDEFARAQAAMGEIFRAALSLGGVLSGEHGIGLEKQRFLKEAMDPVALDLMKKIKGILDPNNILNPGKIWEEEGA